MTASARILIVEDDPAIGPRIVAGFIREGFDAVLAADGPSGREELLAGGFDLCVLDLMLPGADGYALLEAWRDRCSVPVIVLTARTGLPDRLRSFEEGACDFLPKPFFMEELQARVRARLGLDSAPTPSRTVTVGPCVLDLDARRVTCDGQDRNLTAHEVNLLAVLVSHPGRAFTRVQLAARALPDEGMRQDRTVDSHISHLRRKLGREAAACIRTVRSVGYRFDPPGS